MQLVFDLDGVLLDSESDLRWLRAALDATLEEIDLAVTPEHREKLMPGNLGAIPQVAASWEVPVTELWAIRNERYLSIKLSAIRSGEIGPFPDVTALRDGSWPPRHIISNSPEAVVNTFIEVTDLVDCFGERLGRGNELASLDRLKPAPYFYEKLVETTGRDADFLYIGNSLTDREFAENTGMDYFHIDRGDGDGLWELRDRLS